MDIAQVFFIGGGERLGRKKQDFAGRYWINLLAKPSRSNKAMPHLVSAIAQKDRQEVNNLFSLAHLPAREILIMY